MNYGVKESNVRQFVFIIVALLIYGQVMAGMTGRDVRALDEQGNNLFISTIKMPTSDTISYDDGTISYTHEDTLNWAGVRFTPVAPFDLQAIYMMVSNEFGNSSDGCSLYVVLDNGEGLPDWPEGVLDSLWVEPPMTDIDWIQVDLDSAIRFSTGEDFHIIYGPAPGGEYPSEGWWIGFDADGTTTFRTFTAYDDREVWDTVFYADALVRVGGEYVYSETIQYDDYADGDPTFSYYYNDTDIVLGWFAPSGPCSLHTISMKFETPGEIIFHIWETPDDTSIYYLGDDLIPPETMYIAETYDWTIIDFGGDPLFIDNPEGIYVGYELTYFAPDPIVLSDTSASHGIHSRSFTYAVSIYPEEEINPYQSWHSVFQDTLNYDLLFRADVSYLPTDSGQPGIKRYKQARFENEMAETFYQDDTFIESGRAGKKIAILIGPYSELWKEISFAYCGLLKHGYQKGDIIVAYAGTKNKDLDGDGQANDVDTLARNVKDIDAIFDNTLITSLTAEDDLLIYIASHGGLGKGGFFAFPGYNEEEYTGGRLKGKINALKCGVVKILLDFCYSGDMVKGLKKLDKDKTPKKIISANTIPGGKGASGKIANKYKNWSNYCLGVWSAINGWRPGKKDSDMPWQIDLEALNVDADYNGNNDNKIQLSEAHKWCADSIKTWWNNTVVKLHSFVENPKGDVGAGIIWEENTKPEIKEKPGKVKNCEINGKLMIYSLRITNKSVWPIHRVGLIIDPIDVTGMGDIHLDINGAKSRIFPADTLTLDKGSKMIRWTYREDDAVDDYFGIQAFGLGKRSLSFCYANEDYKLKKQIKCRFYNDHDDEVDKHFAEVTYDPDTTLLYMEDIVINEIAMRPTESGGNEWIEIYNPTEYGVDLSGWTIVHLDSTNFAAPDTISTLYTYLSPGSFYLVELPGEPLIDSLDEILLIDTSGFSVDGKSWDESDTAFLPPPEGQTLAAECDGGVPWSWATPTTRCLQCSGLRLRAGQCQW